MQRTSIVTGPGALTFGGQTWIGKDGINAGINIETGEVDSSLHGTVDEFIKNKHITAGLTPLGRLTAERLAILFPHQNPVIGSSIFGAADSPAVIHSRAGKSLTLHNAALTSIPDLLLGADRTAIGSIELMAVLADGKDWTAADALYTLATAAFSEPAIDTSEIKRVAYTAVWGNTFVDVVAKDGWTISFGLDLSNFDLADLGTIDKLLSKLTVTAKCTPANLSEAMLDEMKLQGAGAGIGSSLRQGNDLTITGINGLTVVLKDAAFKEGPLNWNGTDLRSGEIAFQAQRSAGTGALYSVALTA